MDIANNGSAPHFTLAMGVVPHVLLIHVGRQGRIESSIMGGGGKLPENW